MYCRIANVPAFHSSYSSCMALLAVLKQANLILMPCQSYLRVQSVMFWLGLKQSISKFGVFFFLCQPWFLTPSYIGHCFQDSSKYTKCWNKTPEPAAQASLRLLESWPVMSWFESVPLWQVLSSALQIPAGGPSTGPAVSPGVPSYRRHPHLTCWNTEAEAGPWDLVASFHLTYHIWDSKYLI